MLLNLLSFFVDLGAFLMLDTVRRWGGATGDLVLDFDTFIGHH